MAATSVCRSCNRTVRVVVHPLLTSESGSGARDRVLYRAQRHLQATSEGASLRWSSNGISTRPPPAVSTSRYSTWQGMRGHGLGQHQGKCVGLASAAPGSPEKEQAGSIRDGVVDLLLDGGKTTCVAHAIWQRVVQSGDLVIDATCGNGWDTVQLAKLVFSESNPGGVIGVDVQEAAVHSTSRLLDLELAPAQRKQVELYTMCHSKIQDLADDASVRLVAFNLGYLPGGDKQRITTRDTTVKALDAATRLVKSGGLISLMAYVGHPGGREEYEAVREYTQSLPTESWVVSHLEWLNRPMCPRLLFLSRK